MVFEHDLIYLREVRNDIQDCNNGGKQASLHRN